MCDREHGRAAAQAHPERWKLPARGNDFVTIVDRTELVRFLQRLIDFVLVMAKMNRRPQLEPRRFSGAGDSIADVDGILEMRHRDPLLDLKIADVINPDRHPVFEPEFAQTFGAL